jgi:hypothetical protein
VSEGAILEAHPNEAKHNSVRRASEAHHRTLCPQITRETNQSLRRGNTPIFRENVLTSPGGPRLISTLHLQHWSFEIDLINCQPIVRRDARPMAFFGLTSKVIWLPKITPHLTFSNHNSIDLQH